MLRSVRTKLTDCADGTAFTNGLCFGQGRGPAPLRNGAHHTGAAFLGTIEMWRQSSHWKKSDSGETGLATIFCSSNGPFRVDPQLGQVGRTGMALAGFVIRTRGTALSNIHL